MARQVKVAAAQLGPIHLRDDRDSVVRRLMALMREAHGAGARFVVFPELALTTFFPRYWITEQATIDSYFEAGMPAAATVPLFDLARDLRMGFYLGYAELSQAEAQTRRYNASILVDPAGSIVGKYRKIHLPGHVDHMPNAPFQHLEKRYFDVGDGGFRVHRFMDTLVGMCICNDRRWPETFRVMALQSADLVVLGYNTPTENIHHPEPPHLRMHHHLITLQANAYQNALWVVAVAKAGREDGFSLMGGSCIVAPTGEIAAQALTEDDEVVAYSCDLELGEYIRRSVFDFARHRRVEHYKLIVERTAAGPPLEG